MLFSQRVSIYFDHIGPGKRFSRIGIASKLAVRESLVYCFFVMSYPGSYSAHLPRLLLSGHALRANLQSLVALSKPDTAFWPVIKADAYGLGASGTLEQLNSVKHVKGFFVATFEEALELYSLTSKPIGVFHGFLPQCPMKLPERILPVINHLDQLIAWAKAPKTQKVMIAIDTGMNRLGLSQNDVSSLKEDAQLQTALRALNLTYWISHYACADEANNIANVQQWRRMQQAVSDLSMMASSSTRTTSMAASAGLYLDSSMHGDMARPGIALYGGHPTPDPRCKAIRSVVTLQVPILQIRHLKANETVGYGNTWRATQKTTIAILALGYADGWLRHFSNELFAYDQQHPCPIVGRISMDSLAVDISKRKNLQVGHFLSLINDFQTINHIAHRVNTIPYEVLTLLGSRLQRIWQ